MNQNGIPFNVDALMFLRLLIAVVLGALIGFERKRAVLALLVDGWNNTRIAERLIVSPSTITSHVSQILSKLGVASRTEATALATGTLPDTPSLSPPSGGDKHPPAGGGDRGV